MLAYLTSSKENYLQCPEHIQRESYAEICVYASPTNVSGKYDL